MKFIKYSSIENTYKENLIENVKKYSCGVYWMVTEKVHGANLSFYINSEEIKVASRNNFLDNPSEFHNANLILLKYSDSLKKLYNEYNTYFEKNKTKFVPELDYIIIYGEIYGGNYPHPSVEKSNSRPVQKGVYYTPHIDFIAFDIKRVYKESEDLLFKGLTSDWTPHLDFEKLCKTVNLPYTKYSFIGDFESALKFSNETNKDQTYIPGLHKLPPIHNNIREGNVIKPLIRYTDSRGNRIIFKDKNSLFKEKSGKIKKIKTREIDNLTDEEINGFVEEARTYFTKQRLDCVKSKMVKEDNELLKKLFKKDLIKDFNKDYNKSFIKKTNKQIIFIKISNFIDEKIDEIL